MSPPKQGVQRQVPPNTPLGAQQSQARTIQPNSRHIPQQQPTTDIPVPQQGFPGTNSFMQQPVSGRIQASQNTQQSMPQQVPMTPLSVLPTTPRQGNMGGESLRENSPIVRHGGVPSSPQASSGWGQQAPVLPQEQRWGQSNRVAEYTPKQVVRTSTPPLTTQQGNVSNKSLEPLQWGLSSLPNTPIDVPLSQESLAATSKAAVHWRQSWLDRQHAEAGPAVGVSRGQAAVPEPLLAMQHSLARMRAIMTPKSAMDSKGSSLGFWLSVIMLICLIGGLSTYAFSTHPGAHLDTNPVSTGMNIEPTLTIKAAKTTQVAVGQSIQVHGEHFGQNDAILFFLGDTQLKDAAEKPITIQSNDKGTFDATLPIPATQLAGDYVLQAQDNHTGQHAFLDIQTTVATNTDVLKLSVPSLAFASIVGQRNPDGQSVSITNTSNAALQWSATAISNNQTGWLVLDTGKTSGQLDVGQTNKISISVLTDGLKSSPKNQPYTGEVVFTVPHQGQIMLQVQLNIAETGVELAINPNPITAITSPTIPGGCQPTTLTLINLSNTAVHWEVKTDDFSQQHITIDGKADEQDQLTPTGSPTDTKVIQIGCKGVQLDKTYAVTVYYNGNQQLVPIGISKQQ